MDFCLDDLPKIIIDIIIFTGVFIISLIITLIGLRTDNSSQNYVGGKVSNSTKNKLLNMAKLQYKHFDNKKVDVEQINKFKELYYKHHLPDNTDPNSTVLKYPLLTITIKNNKISDYTCDKIKDDRIEHNLNLIRNTLLWAQNNKLKKINTTMYIWISDRQPWHMKDIEMKVPIMLYAKPEDTKFIVFPDNTFDTFNIKKKYTDISYNWDDVIKDHKKYIIPYNDKKDTVYFKGTSTTRDTSHVREQFEKKSDDTFIVKLDAWESYELFYKWSEYKYLLNLPGHYPWSNRFKYLPLLKSLIINVNTETVSEDYHDKPFITFIDFILEKNKDYIDIPHKYYPNKNNDESLNKKQIEENLNVYNKIMDIRNNTSKSEYNKIINSAYNKISSLCLDDIYYYIYNLLLQNSLISP